MSLPLSLQIALRNIRQKRDNRFVSFVAFVATFGLILGVAALITVLSVLNGFERALEDKLLGLIPHIQIYPNKVSEDWQSVLADIRATDPNIAAVAPNINTQMMAIGKSSTDQKEKVQVLSLLGISPYYEQNISILAKPSENGQGVIAGSLASVENTNAQNIVIGEWLADALNLKVGDSVQVVIPKGSSSPSGITPVGHTFQVSGIFKLTNQTEKYLALTSLENVGEILQLQNGVTGFKLKLNDVFAADITAKRLQQKYPDFTIHHWIQTHGSIYEALKMQRNMMALLLLLIIMVAGFNLVSSLVMTVAEKKSDIAILKTMGATSSLVRMIFFWQGFVIATVGTLVGVALGLLLSYNIGWLSNWLNQTFALNLFDRYFVTQLPSDVRFWDVLMVSVASIIIGTLATYYPAKKASKTDPAMALRYE